MLATSALLECANTLIFSFWFVKKVVKALVFDPPAIGPDTSHHKRDQPLE